MDLNQLKMTYGEVLWGKKYNDFVEAVAQAFGEGSNAPLGVQKISGSDAVVMMNGATPNGGGGSISWIQFNGVKIVQLSLTLTVPDKADFNTPYGQIPASLAPQGAMGWALMGDPNSVMVDVTSDGKLWSKGSGQKTWHAVYFHIDQ